jgi:hypothetical protein
VCQTLRLPHHGDAGIGAVGRNSPRSSMICDRKFLCGRVASPLPMRSAGCLQVTHFARGCCRMPRLAARLAIGVQSCTAGLKLQAFMRRRVAQSI